MTDAPMPPEWFATIDLAKRDTPGPHDTPELLAARLAEERRRALDNALTVLAGTGRVRIQRIPCERQALKVVREALAARDAQIADLQALVRQVVRRDEEAG